MPITLSIIIVNYNTLELTSKCIQSVLENLNVLTFEIILVDNNSDEVDADLFLEKFPVIKLIKSKANLGFAKGNNLGIANAAGNYILLLNSDAQLQGDSVSHLINFLEANPKIAVTTTQLVFPNGSLQHNCQRFPSVKAKAFELLRLQKIAPKTGGHVLLGPFFKYNEVAYPDWVWGTFFLFRKDLLQQLPDHKLADDFFMYGEDMQWCFEFHKRGYRMAFVPTTPVVHHMGMSRGNAKKWMAEHHQQFLNKYYGPLHRFMLRLLDRLLGLTAR